MYPISENKSLKSIKVEATEDNNVELFHPRYSVEGVLVSDLLTDAINGIRSTNDTLFAYIGDEAACGNGGYDIYKEAVDHLNKAAFCVSSLMGLEVFQTMYHGKEVRTELTKEEYCKRIGVSVSELEDSE